MHRLHVDEIDILVESDAKPIEIADAPPTEADRAIAGHVQSLVPKARRCRPASDRFPQSSPGCSPKSDGGDYGVHSEMFTTGLMRLHESGKVTNRKGQFDGVSVATFAAGTGGTLRVAGRQSRGRVLAGRRRELGRSDRAEPPMP